MIGTMFPEIGGGGDLGDRDAGQILEWPTPPLNEPEPEAAPEPQGDDDTTPDDSGVDPAGLQTPQPRAPQGRRSARDRIRGLVGQVNEQRQTNDDLRQQIAAMNATIENLTRSFSQSSQRKASQQDPLGLGNDNQNTPSQQPVEHDLESLLDRKLAPIVQRINQTDNLSRLGEAHRQSFERAAQDYPDLRNPDSPLRRVFDELYSTSPVAALDNGPEHLAIQARGLLADERADSRATNSRKATAAANVPNQPAAPVERSAATKLTKEETAALNAARERSRLGKRTFADYKTIRLLTAKAEGQPLI